MGLDVFDAIALTIHANDNEIISKTTVQKLIYFHTKMIENLDISNYAPHFYGPFNREVSTALEDMSEFSYIDQNIISGYYETYNYKLTKKGIEYAETAKEEKLELVTSTLTTLQYLGSVHELFVTQKIDRQTRSDYLSKYAELERDLKNSLVYVHPTEDVLDIGIMYSLDRHVNHERAIHMATATASKCDTYVMVDKKKDINKKEWKKQFEMLDLSEYEDRDSGLEKINRL